MEYWENRWITGQTGWHRSAFSELLLKHWPSLELNSKCEVFVPLCGKSLDMIWLAENGHTITGVEFAKPAVETFFQENEIEHEITKYSDYQKFSGEKFTILNSDFFDLESGIIHADAWYDRAAMIAVKPNLRRDYVNQIRRFTKVGAVGLLITYTYPQKEMEGPPFSLEDEDVYNLFNDGFNVKPLERIDLEDERERGLSRISSTVFKITRIPN